MAIQSIDTSNFISEALKTGSSRKTEDGDSFANILSDALSGAGEAEATDNVSALSLLTEDASNLHNFVLETEKAQLALDLAVQVRNKVVDAYNEIMRMQV